jgi:hypothetical protein
MKIVDGQPFEHPATEQNLLDAFGCIPEGFEPFEHVEEHDKVIDELRLQSHRQNLVICRDYIKRDDGVWTHDWYLE